MSGAVEQLAAAAELRQPHQQVALGLAEPEPVHLALEPHEVAAREALQQRQVRLLRHPERVEQAPVERAVADAQPVAAQAGLVEGGDRERHHLGLALGARHADQLDARLEELARLAHAAIGGAPRARDVGEAERRLGLGVAGGHHARDRDRHVRAQREHRALLVEGPVARARGALVAAPQHVLVLERRRVHLAVARVLEGGAHPVADRAQLAHLLGQHVPGPRGDGVRHMRRLRYAGTRSAATRSMRAPSVRSRSSIRS